VPNDEKGIAASIPLPSPIKMPGKLLITNFDSGTDDDSCSGVDSHNDKCLQCCVFVNKKKRKEWERACIKCWIKPPQNELLIRDPGCNHCICRSCLESIQPAEGYEPAVESYRMARRLCPCGEPFRNGSEFLFPLHFILRIHVCMCMLDIYEWVEVGDGSWTWKKNLTLWPPVEGEDFHTLSDGTEIIPL
jgi:hypothetical protein